MDNRSTTLGKRNHSSLGFAVLLLTCFTLAFWVTAYYTNVYRWAVGGAIFELLWLPMLMAVLALPVVSFLHWRKEKFRVPSLFLYALLVCVAMAVWLYLHS